VDKASNEQLMPRVSRERLRADHFRVRAAELLTDSDWLEEEVRGWLQKELQRARDYIYTENEHGALARIVAASTSFDGWDGYTISQLITAACRYKADGDYEDERFLHELRARNPARLRLREMGHLVGLCRSIAGQPLAPFRPEITRYDEVSEAPTASMR
jgi:hypothetical protein